MMQSRSNDTRNKILSTSFELFSQQGYDTTGVAQICAEANISKGAFYHHFPSKHELFLTLLEGWLKEIDEVFHKIQNENPSSLEQLKLMSLELNSIFSKADQFPMFLEVWLQAMRDSSISQKTIAPYYRYLSFFESVFIRGQTDGSIATQSDSRLSSRLMMGFAMGIILQCTIEPQGEDWQNLTRFGVDTILTGLQKESI